MLVIRLARIGRKNTAQFRLILQEKTQSPKSIAKEQLGVYNPLAKERKDQVKMNTERITFWMSKGAQPSETVHNMLVEFGVIKGKKKRVVRGKKAETAEAKA